MSGSDLPADKDLIASVAVLVLTGFSFREFSQIADALSLANRIAAPARFRWDVYGIEHGRVARRSTR